MVLLTRLIFAWVMVQVAGCGTPVSPCQSGPTRGDIAESSEGTLSDVSTEGLREAAPVPQEAGCKFFCDEMVKIPPGAFAMGCRDTNGGPCRANEKPRHTVMLDGFWIDKYEVTYGQFAKFLSDNETGEKPDGNVHFWNDYSFIKKGDEYELEFMLPTYAVENATWHGATAFCEWAGKRLCSEAEWERAASGDDARQYPWGDAPPSCPGVSLLRSGGPVFDPEPACGLRAHQMPGGSDQHWVGDGGPPEKFYLDESPFGVMNMAGNVSEWVSDLYGATYYESSPTYAPMGPAVADLGVGVTVAAYRVVRGGRGSWDEAERFRVSFRQAVDSAADEAEHEGGSIGSDWGVTSNAGIRCCLGPTKTH